MGPELTLQTRVGRLREAAEAAALVYDSDPPYYDFLFGSPDGAQTMLARLWREENGSTSHARMQVWLADGKLLALASHYPAARAALIEADDAKHIARLDACDTQLSPREASLAWLFPHIPAHAWYLRTLAVAGQARGQGAGSQVLQNIARSAHSQGATELHTDVDSGNPGAVRFYQHHGFEIIAETRVPILEPFNLPASYRMVKKLA